MSPSNAIPPFGRSRRLPRSRASVLAVLIGSAGCASAPTPTIPPLRDTVAPSDPAPVPPPPPLVFVEDDYARALAEAKTSGKALFIDAWAPWCHTCLSMRSYVFSDDRVRALASRFVWLAIDTEKPSNAPFLDKYPMQFWPTLWVVDAKTEQPSLKWLGSATAPELVSLLEDAAAGASQSSAEGEAAASLLRGKRASAAAKHDEAIREYRAALSGAPPQWKRRATTDEALVSELWMTKDDVACAGLADVELAKIPSGTSLANVGLLGLQCARRAPAGSTTRALAPRLARAVEQIALDPSVPMLDDDRSGLFEEVVEDRGADGDSAGAKSLATSWSALIDARASEAKTASARAVWDAHRVLAYVAKGEPERALPMLAQSEHDFPDDYNPPARIARVNLLLTRYDDALAAIKRALARGYGPRKLKLYLLEADIRRAQGDAAGVRRAVDEALAYVNTLPAPERPAGVIKDLEARRSEAK